jgi:redox-sensitive bicupin YhaK (pirin superfamily)
MTAGTGVRHSEFNHSPSELVHFLQIWIVPHKQGLPPGYEEREFADSEKRGKLRLIAARDARDGSVKIHQDVDLYASLLGARETLVHDVNPGRKIWIQVARGAIDVNRQNLRAGDGVAIADEARVTIRGEQASEILLFDMA